MYSTLRTAAACCVAATCALEYCSLPAVASDTSLADAAIGKPLERVSDACSINGGTGSPAAHAW